VRSHLGANRSKVDDSEDSSHDEEEEQAHDGKDDPEDLALACSIKGRSGTTGCIDQSPERKDQRNQGEEQDEDSIDAEDLCHGPPF